MCELVIDREWDPNGRRHHPCPHGNCLWICWSIGWMDGWMDLAIAVVARIVADDGSPRVKSAYDDGFYAARIGRSSLQGLLTREEGEITIRSSLFFQIFGNLTVRSSTWGDKMNSVSTLGAISVTTCRVCHQALSLYFFLSCRRPSTKQSYQQLYFRTWSALVSSPLHLTGAEFQRRLRNIVGRFVKSWTRAEEGYIREVAFRLGMQHLRPVPTPALAAIGYVPLMTRVLRNWVASL